MTRFNVVLFDDFEILDVFGPVAVIEKLPKRYKLEYYSMSGGMAHSSPQVGVNTLPSASINAGGILLIPGGAGVRKQVNDSAFLETVKDLSCKSQFVLTVCTGSAILAKTGLLNGKKATSNKLAFDWVCSNGNDVHWVKNARWVKDEKFYTSSGVTAGIDMTLGFVCDIHGEETANDVCRYIEYVWRRSKDSDF